MSATPIAEDGRPLDRAIARQAAAWLVRLQEDATPVDVAACDAWRAADAEHERAWQRAQRLAHMFDAVPPQVGMHALNRDRRGDAAQRRAAIKALTILLLTGSAGYSLSRNVPWRDWISDERTATGERRAVRLADGSEIELNTRTAFNVAFSPQERALILNDGEILVETGHDPHNPSAIYRPFIVRTVQGQVRALGTRFVVRQEYGATQVSVLHGAVEITSRDTVVKRVVAAGQQTRFTARLIDPAAPVDPHVADWSQGVLFADQMRLGDFLAELSRYRPGVLRCDPAVAALRISGAFQLRNTDDILAALPDTLPVGVVYRTRYWVSVVAASGAGEAQRV